MVRNLQIKSALRDCKAARDQLTTDWDSQNSSNTTGRRTFKRGILYCKGATSEVNFRGISVDDAIVDDLNGAPISPEGEKTREKTRENKDTHYLKEHLNKHPHCLNATTTGSTRPLTTKQKR